MRAHIFVAEEYTPLVRTLVIHVEGTGQGQGSVVTITTHLKVVNTALFQL